MSHEIHETDANMQEITRLRAELAATRADLDTLRNGVAWLGAELAHARRWGALWKRAAKGQWNRAEWWQWRHGNVHRAARRLVAAWREEREESARWEGLAVSWRIWAQAQNAPEAPTEPPAQAQGGAAGA